MHLSPRLRLVLPLLPLLPLLLAACAVPPAPPRPNTEAEDAEMLRLAREARLELRTQSARLAELEGQVRDLSEMIGWNAAQTAANTRALDSARRGAGATPPAAAAAPASGRVSPDEATAYRAALDLHFARRYSEAIEAFRGLLSRHPEGAYSGNAEYWIGEGLYAQEDYGAALAAFRRVFSHAGTPKLDDAQLKLGYCLLRLNDRAGAISAFRKLVSSHPDSEYVERARTELRKLGAE